MAFVLPVVTGASARSSTIHGVALDAHTARGSTTTSTRPNTVPRPAVVRAVAVNPDKSKARKLAKIESLKIDSKHLRYPIAEQLANSEIFISENAVQIMKFHGSYQQDDRERRAPGQQRKFQFMLRLKMPAGDFPADMYRALDDLSNMHGNKTLRATTRCSFQMHGILKSDLKTVFSTIMKNGGATVGACGDISRNVMATPAPFVSKPHAQVRFVSKMLAELFAPQTGAFSEIWLDGEKAATLEYWKNDIDMVELKRILRDDNGNGVVFPENEEPIYGDTYLPRKFKFAVTVPGDNSVDIYTQDVGVVVISDASGDTLGYNIIVGGGMGRTHQKESTFPRTGDHLGFVPADKLWDLCKAIVAVQRDHGNREVRTNARMKYLIHKLGIDEFRKLVESYYGDKVEPFREMIPWKYHDWLGWHEQGDGNLFLGLFIENGRIKDDGEMRLKSALRRIVDAFGFDLVVTPNQNVMFKNINPNQVSRVEAVLKGHGVKLVEEYDMNRRLSMACPAMPLCGLAVTEAERHMPSLVTRMNSLFDRTGVTVPITMRMTGCPNGCARPYMAELGFVGSGPMVYQLWVGGCPNQTRLAFPILEKVKDENLESTLEPLLHVFREQASPSTEAFGDFCARLGKEEVLRILQTPLSKNQNADTSMKPSTAVATKASNKSSQATAPPAAGSPSNNNRNDPSSNASRWTEVMVYSSPTRVTVVGDVILPVETDWEAPQVTDGNKVSPGLDESLTSTTEATDDDDDDSETERNPNGLKQKARPRLTVSPSVLARLKNIAGLRGMTPSQVANEIISTFLSGIDDEQRNEDGGML